MASLYREFPLRTPSMWQALAAFVRANFEAVRERGGCLRIIVTEDERNRTKEQNRFYWGPVLKQVSEQAWVNGRSFKAASWHEHFANEHMPRIEVATPFGEIISRRKSTTELTVAEFSEYIQRVQSYAASELGVVFE